MPTCGASSPSMPLPRQPIGCGRGYGRGSRRVVDGEFRAMAATNGQAQPDRTELLGVSGLKVGYGTAVALDDLDLTVRRNELFVLLGASGSGKTTLLRALAGFVRPDAGRI